MNTINRIFATIAKVENIKDMKTDIEKAKSCDVVMEPGRLDNLKERILVILPNEIENYLNVRTLVTHLNELAPNQPIVLGKPFLYPPFFLNY